ncbi:unnamed protein product [Caenorhabditis nigoni]
MMVIDRKNSLDMKPVDSKRAFVKKRSKVTASEVRKHVISGLLPIHRLTDGENGFNFLIREILFNWSYAFTFTVHRYQ